MRLALAAATAVFVLVGPSTVSAHDISSSGPAPDAASILAAWSFEPSVVIGLAALVVVYGWLVRRVDRAHPAHPWPRQRVAYLAGAVATLVVALCSPIDSLSDDLATVHMVQHMLLLMVAPPLLAASGLGTLALRGATKGVRERWLLPILHSRATAVITFPVVDWLLFTFVLWGTHYGPIYDLALRDPTIHIVEHLLYITAACLFWWPIFSPDPLRWRMNSPAKIGYVFLQMPQMSFLAASILGAPHLLYQAYLNRTVIYGLDPLYDQAQSAAVMWIGGDTMFFVCVLFVVAGWMRTEEAVQKREDARVDRLASGSAANVMATPDRESKTA